MSYAHAQSKTPAGYRRNKDYLTFAVSKANWRKVVDSWGRLTNCKNFGLFLSGGVLWFEALDREEQVGLVNAYEPGKLIRPQVAYVDSWIGEKARNWHFPFFTLGRVMGTISMRFSEVKPDEQAAWVLAVLVGPMGGDK